MKTLRIATWVLLAFLSAHALRHIRLVVAHPYPIEYGEGVNRLWAGRAASGQALYPPVTEGQLPHLHNPYPPMGPMLAGMLLRAGLPGHLFLSGRLLSLLGLVAAAEALYRLIRRRASREAAFLGTLAFLLSPMTLRFGPMMRVDPLALGLSLQALRCFDRGQTPWRAALAAALAATALLVKPTYCAATVYIAIHLLQTKKIRPIAAAFFGGQTPFLFTGIWLFLRESPEWGLHLGVLQNLPAQPGATLAWLGPFAGTHALALALGGLWMGTGPAAERGLRRYALLACLPPLLTGWISGSQENYLLEVWALGCLGAALMWDRLRGQTPKAAGIALFAQALLFLPIAPAPVFTRTYGQELPAGSRNAWTPGATDAEIGRLLLSELRSDEGAMLSSDLGYLLLAGREPLFQPYQFGQLHLAGAWDLRALDQAIANGTFRFILLKGNAETGDDPYFPLPQQKLIAEHATLHRVIGPWHLYRARDLP